MSQTLGQIKEVLDQHGIRPRHRLGQNFLHDANKLRQIIEAAQVQPSQTILEVGPGTGVMTETLLALGARIVAVEIDPAMVQILRDRIGPDCREFQLLETDVLQDKHTLAPAVTEALADEPYALVANLPYQVATPLVATLLVDHPHMTQAVVMVQKEVADRFTAPPGNKTYGTVGILAQALCEVQMITTLSPDCFWPKPKVSSAVLQLRRRETPLTDHPQALSALVRLLFAQRRKQVGTILRNHGPFPKDIDPTQRPEQLTVEQMVLLSQTMRL